jgi:hypothetical protein
MGLQSSERRRSGAVPDSIVVDSLILVVTASLLFVEGWAVAL